MAARARDGLTNIYYKKRKIKETVYHPAFIMLGGGGGGGGGVWGRSLNEYFNFLMG